MTPFVAVELVLALVVVLVVGALTFVWVRRRYISGDGRPVMPPTILTEAVAQVGAIMILVKPENREKLIFFMGIEKVRYRRPVHAGDQVQIEAVVRRLRSKMGMLRGIARVDGKVVVEGTMTFALGPKTAAP